MTLPANVRVNVGAPFPSVTKGSAPVSIAKANGIWTIGLSIDNLTFEQPSILQQQTDYLLVQDAIVGNFFRIPLSAITSGGIGSGSQRSVTAGPVVIVDSDRILNLNLSSSGTITLPPYASRNGVPLTFKDVGMKATANPQTIAAAAGETIDTVNASIPLNVNNQSITLVPANDGVNTGWFEE